MATTKRILFRNEGCSQACCARSLVSRAGLFLLRSREASIAIAGIVLIIYFQSTASAFLSPSNIGNLAEYTAMTAIIAAGLVMVL
jgi:simple sugar transport system permease protein